MKIGHNSTLDPDKLHAFITRIESLAAEKAELQGDITELFADAKEQGYDTAAMRQVIKERKLSREEREEREAVLETYRHALGMLSDLPLGEAALGNVLGAG